MKEEVKTSLALQAHRDEWKKIERMITIDGWTDKRTMINFLVNNQRELFMKSVE